MADPFVIYTLGDTGLFASALNGIAMLFNDSPLFHGNGFADLGFGAFFGFVILFAIWLYNAAFKQQMDLKSLLAPFILYVVLTVPKATVIVEDIYTGSARNIDNIPIGLALPASVASGISVYLTDVFEKAYSVIGDDLNSDPISIRDEGYVTPLKLINALRDSATITPSQSLLQTTKNMYQSCIATNSNFSVEEYKKSADPIKYFADIAATSEQSVVYVNLAAQGTITESLMNCKQAGESLRAAFQAYLDGINGDNENGNSTNSVNKIIGDVTVYNLRNAIIRQMNANGDTAGFNLSPSNPNGDYSINDMVGFVSRLSNTSQENSRNFMMATIFNPMLESASYCYGKSAGMAEMSKCSAWLSSKTQWEEKNAASATGFLQVMRDGQNVLIIFSFLIFPIMVLFIMIKGVGSFKIIGNYLAFTVSVYLWLPMASLINFYIQSSLVGEWSNVVAATGITSLNLITGPQFYAAVSQKLALGNALLASVPILCMMIFTGMMQGMSQLTGRMNSADAGNYDAKVNSPDISKSAPLAASSSTVTTTGAGVSYLNGLPRGSLGASSTISKSDEITRSHSNDLAAAQSALNQLQSTTGLVVSNGKVTTHQSGSSLSHVAGDTVGSASVTSHGTDKSLTNVNAKTTGLSTGDSNTNETKKGFVGSVGANAGVSGTASPSKGDATSKNNATSQGSDKDKKFDAKGMFSGGLGANGAVVGSSSKGNASTTNLNQGESTALNRSNGNFDSTATTKTYGKTEATTSTQLQQDLSAVQEHIVRTKGHAFAEQYSSNFAETQKAINTLKQSEQQSVNFTKSIEAKDDEIAGAIKYNPERFQNAIKGVDLQDANFQSRVNSNITDAMGGQTSQDARNVAIIRTLFNSDNPEHSAAARQFISPTMANSYNNMAKNVPTQVEDPTAKVREQTQNIAPKLDQNIPPEVDAKPTSQVVTAPTATPKGAIPTTHQGSVSVVPVNYSQQVQKANREVAKDNEQFFNKK